MGARFTDNFSNKLNSMATLSSSPQPGKIKDEVDQAFAGIPQLQSQNLKMKLDLMILELIGEGKLPEQVAEELRIPAERVELAMQSNYDADST